MNSNKVGRFLRRNVVHTGLCLHQSRLSCSRSAKTTQAVPCMTVAGDARAPRTPTVAAAARNKETLLLAADVPMCADVVFVVTGSSSLPVLGYTTETYLLPYLANVSTCWSKSGEFRLGRILSK